MEKKWSIAVLKVENPVLPTKWQADIHIIAELMWHLDNYNCLKVVLGASHDNGYARTLSSIVSEGNDARVLLVEGTPFASEVRSLHFQSTKLLDIFESQKLGIPKYVVPNYAQPKIPASPKTSSSYANAAVASANTINDAPMMSKPLFIGSNTKKLAPLQHQAAITRIKSLQPAPCNDHYLVGFCWKDSCFFSHKHNLNAAEIQAMRIRVGLTRCEFGEQCINEKCYRGHTCQNIRNGKCVRPNCPFLDSEHPTGVLP